MTAVRPYGLKIDFARKPISESAAWFFDIILWFILTPIFENKYMKKIINEKKEMNPWRQKYSLTSKKNTFSEANFHK